MTEENTEQLQSVSGVDTCGPHIADTSGTCGETVIEGGVIPISELLPQTVNGVDSSNTIFAAAIPFSVNGTIPEGTILHITPDATIVALEAVNALQSAGQFGNSTIILSEPAQCSSGEALPTSSNENSESNEHLSNEPLTLDKVIEHNTSDLGSRTSESIEEIDLTGFLNKSEYNQSGSFSHDKSLGNEVRNPSCSSEEANLGTVLEQQEHLSALPEIQSSQEQSQSDDSHVPADTEEIDQTSGSDSNVVVVDISKPIQLSQNSLIVVNGQKCILQQDPQTGQVFAYPLREPDKPKRKRGRPRKVVNEAQQAEDPSAAFSAEHQLQEEEEPHERGMLEVANEDGTIVRRSTRKRKQANTLKDYETGNLKLVLGSEEEDDREEAEEEIPEEPETDSPPKKRGKGRGRPKKNAQPPLTSSTPFSFLQPVKRGRGRPRRYGLPKEAMQAFLVQTADGQALMMQVPMSSIPSGMSLQAVAQGIANSLNTSNPQSVLSKVLIGNAKVDRQVLEDQKSSVTEDSSSNSEQVQEIEMHEISSNLDGSGEQISTSALEADGNTENLGTCTALAERNQVIHYSQDIGEVQIHDQGTLIEENDNHSIHEMQIDNQGINDVQNDSQVMPDEQDMNKEQNSNEDIDDVQINNQGTHEIQSDNHTVSNEVQRNSLEVHNEIQSDNHGTIIQKDSCISSSELHNHSSTIILQCINQDVIHDMQNYNRETSSEMKDFNSKIITEVNDNTSIIKEVLIYLLKEVETMLSVTNSNHSYDLPGNSSLKVLVAPDVCTNEPCTVEPLQNAEAARNIDQSIISEKCDESFKTEQDISESQKQKSTEKNTVPSQLTLFTVPFKPKRRPGRPRKHPLPSVSGQLSSQKSNLISESGEIASGIKLDQQITNIPILASVLPVPQVTSSSSSENSTSVVTAPATVIPLPEKLLPLILPKSESPVKLGLKANETELEKLHCPRCDFQAYYLHQYQEHLAIHAEEAFQCKCCSFLCFDDDELIQHYKEHHPRCICCICNHTAEHAYIIKRHMYRHSESGCSCDICGKTYKDHYILKMHVKMVHMPAEVLFECNVCNKKFNRKAHLKRHLRTHDPDKPFKCDLCEYRGCEKSDITKHTLIHEEPKHSCEICGKAFRHLKNKELHLKRHKGQRDYKCGICEFYGYTFTDIRKHIERRHSDPRTIFCNQCGQVFKSEELLKVHQDSNQCEIYMIEQSLGDRETVIHIPTDEDVHVDENIDVPSVQLAASGDQEITGIATITLEDGSVATLNALGNIQDSARIVVKNLDGSSVLAHEDTQIVVSGIHSSGIIMPNGQLAIMSEEGRSDTQVALMTTSGEECRTIDSQEAIEGKGEVEAYILPTSHPRGDNQFSSEHITMVTSEGMTLNGVTLDEGKLHQQVQIIGIS